jgi:hypothetical protein
MGAWNSRYLPEDAAGEARYAELFFALPLSEHLAMIERFYFRDLRQTYRGHDRVQSGIMRLHEAVTRG